jgi:Protein of unknown function (DUF3617)
MDLDQVDVEFVLLVGLTPTAADAWKRWSNLHHFDSVSLSARARKILMHRATLRPLIAALVVASATFAAQAQTTPPPPPIKPGLWQVQIDREVNGQKTPDMSERLKNMPPEKRAQFEAMMKQHGIGMGGAANQICYTKEMLEHSPWADIQTDCKPTFSTRTSSVWKWHTTCPKSGYEADGEAIFADHENYTVKSTSVSKVGDKVRNSSTTMTGKWQSADCGDVKPLDAKP